MSHFSDRLDAYIRQTGRSYTEIARRAGIERTQLLKMKNGERPGDEAMVESLCGVLMLSAAQTEELCHLHRIARMGDGVYARRRLVQTLIERMGEAPTALPVSPERESALDVLPASMAVSGYGAVLDLLRAAMIQEAARPNAFLRVIAQPEDDALTELLAAFGRHSPGLHVRQIVCFQQGIRQGGENRYNIECFIHSIPLITSGCFYELFYYYDEVSVRFNLASLLPCLLLTSACCIQFSKDMKHALYSRLPDHIALQTTLFEQLLQTARPVFTLAANALTHLQTHLVFEMPSAQAETPFYTFGTVPCMAMFFDEPLLFQYINRDMPNVSVVAEQYARIIRDVYSAMRALRTTAYFSLDGLRYFLQSGRVVEIPDAYYHPLAEKTREKLLRAMLAAGRTGHYIPMLVDTQKCHVPKNLFISALREDAVQMMYLHPQLGALAFMLEEPSLCYAVYDFMSYLQTSGMVFSQNETIRTVLSQLNKLGTAPALPVDTAG